MYGSCSSIILFFYFENMPRENYQVPCITAQVGDGVLLRTLFVAEKDLKLEFIRVRSFYKRRTLSTVVAPNDEEIQISPSD